MIIKNQSSASNDCSTDFVAIYALNPYTTETDWLQDYRYNLAGHL